MKRRFIRQNREIARVNSSQSIRIRNLETEISRLLAENIVLREQAINARTEADKWKVAHRVNKEVIRMKEQLEAKLSEVNILVNELGNLPEKVARRSSEKRRRSIQASDLLRNASGEEREPRHRQTLLEQEGRLPAILEDKCYPRQTLETAEIQRLVDGGQNDALESPDLGPPPVAHFDEQEALAFNAAKSPRRTSTELIEESERAGQTAVMSAENRRKRRISTLLRPSDIGPAAEDAAPADPIKPGTIKVRLDEPQKKEAVTVLQPPRAGAKRKLELSELEDTSSVSKELDDFIFQRKAIIAAPPPKSSRFSRPPGRQNPENAEVTAPGSPDKFAQPNRRILAPKSTNSPTKRRVGATFEKPPVDSEDVPETKPEKRFSSRSRNKPLAVNVPPPPAVKGKESMEGQAVEEEQSQMPPKTPPAELGDVMSPFLNEPSTTKLRPPQEMTVTTSVEDVLNGSIGRGSRRAKPAVSYAEPNLRDKMRRPGKALVGAVEGLAKQSTDVEKTHARTGSASADSGNESGKQERQTSSAVTIKEESDVAEQKEAGKWQSSGRAQEGRSEPASPLRGKDIATFRTHKSIATAEENGLSKAISNLSVFDAPLSSPVVGEQQDVSAQQTQTAGRFRRHSVQPSSEQANEHASMSRSSVLKSRRPNSALGVQQPDSRDGSDLAKNGVRRSASVTALPGTNQLNGRSGAASRTHTRTDSASAELPSQLDQDSRGSALTRRRSMMV